MSEKKQILIIDDDLTIRKLISFLLKNAGYATLEAGNASLALPILYENMVNLILCDVQMDDMDGYTFCRTIRKEEKYKSIPLLFVTAKDSAEDKNMAVEAGADDIIAKPFDNAELLSKVESYLKRADIVSKYTSFAPVSEEAPQKAARILLVDDDLTLLKLFQYNLNRAGFNCTTAHSAEIGMQLAKEFHPDIIISDIMMPVIDGFLFRRMLLNDPELKQIPFVFLTSKGTENDILEGYDLGIADYVIKTAGPRIVVAKVSAIIKSLNKEREKIVSEINQAAGSLRAKVVPDYFPEFAGFNVMHWHQPYEGIPGGDFLDYFKLDDNNLAIILGDVMGKKWGAYYFAYAYAGYVRSAIRIAMQNVNEFSPAKILQTVNSSVYKDAKVSEVFTTLSILIVNNLDNTLKYSGAGDLPLIYKNAVTGNIEKLKSKGLLLGFAEEGRYEDIKIKLNKDDLLLVVTDGIFESRNKEGVQYGQSAFYERLNEYTPQTDTLQMIKENFTAFTAGSFEDDVSLITLQVT